MTATLPSPAPRQGQFEVAGQGLSLWEWPAPAGSPDRAPIVLFHDSLGCLTLWRDFPAKLAARTGRRVIAYDRWGFGLSPARADELPLDFIALEARDVFPRLRAQWGIDRFVALGHSVGGAMATECAALGGADCEGLITLAAQARMDEQIAVGIRTAAESFADPEQMGRLRRHHGEKAEWVLNAWVNTWLHPGFAPWSIKPALSRLQAPLLAIHGAADEYGSLDHPQIYAGYSAGPARAEVLHQIGHFPHRQDPEKVLALIRSFLP
ncbi:MAG: alpha/beta fold hydrolase [Zoogloea sp.]|uniref:alpha/beta fold hydrolase n=1 Tax=Zoogloea sp. TaxID=49181 RepID=UPI003F416AA2